MLAPKLRGGVKSLGPLDNRYGDALCALRFDEFHGPVLPHAQQSAQRAVVGDRLAQEDRLRDTLGTRWRRGGFVDASSTEPAPMRLLYIAHRIPYPPHKGDK